MTALAGVTGAPISHSLSPVIHTAWIQALGLDARYQAFEAPDPKDFARLCEQVRRGELAGLNVTSPYKLEAYAAADARAEAALACGSANLLLPGPDASLRCDSTDAEGLLAALDEQAPSLDWSQLRVGLLGAGGAARSAAQAVRQRGAELIIVNRTTSRATELAEAFGGSAGTLDDLETAGLVINALSQPPDADLIARLPDRAVVMDMTYRPVVTPLLRAASDRGLGIVDGLAMLIGQARPSFAAMFGQLPPSDLDVRSVALAALEAR